MVVGERRAEEVVVAHRVSLSPTDYIFAHGGCWGGFFDPFAPWLAVVLAAAQIGGGVVVNLLCSNSEFLIQLKVWNVQDTSVCKKLLQLVL